MFMSRWTRQDTADGSEHCHYKRKDNIHYGNPVSILHVGRLVLNPLDKVIGHKKFCDYIPISDVYEQYPILEFAVPADPFVFHPFFLYTAWIQTPVYS